MTAENPYGAPDQPPSPPAAAPAPYYPAPSAPPQAPPPAYVAPQAYPAYAYPAPTAPAKPSNPLAVTSMICALAAPAFWLLSTFLFWVPILGVIILVFAPVGAILGVILGHVSLRQIARRDEGGRGFALTGVIVGWISVGLALLGILVIGLIAGSIFAFIGAGV
ncbi:DUF4190 domain-containing protein [Microbacterium sp. gxy059]|uniref:DUF4190 domain-containing protein n=1 Tax=Microbacterium sp. gxy059 TaxID=2957199 RepID=UPI003D99CB7C